MDVVFAECRVHSIEFGNTDVNRGTAVFVHGRYGEAAHWEPIAQGLRGAVRCVCVDLPGFGFSYSIRRAGLTLIEGAMLVDRIVESLEALGDSASARGPLILVGHDIGGAIALMAAIRLARRLDGLVLIGAAPLTDPPVELSSGFLSSHARRVRTHARSSSLLSAELKRRVTEPWDIRAIRRSRTAALRILRKSWPRHYERMAWKRAQESLVCPTLLLWGSHDRMSPPEAGTELLKAIPDAELLVHPEGTCWLPLESPSWISSRIREFLYRIGGITARKSLSR